MGYMTSSICVALLPTLPESQTGDPDFVQGLLRNAVNHQSKPAEKLAFETNCIPNDRFIDVVLSDLLSREDWRAMIASAR